MTQTTYRVRLYLAGGGFVADLRTPHATKPAAEAAALAARTDYPQAGSFGLFARVTRSNGALVSNRKVYGNRFDNLLAGNR